MARKSKARTGIDLGTASVKIVHAVGGDRIEKITHLGTRTWDRDDVDTAAETVGALLRDMGLNRKQLGQVAVCVSGPNTLVREVSVPAMSADEFRQTVPFEARKYLQLEEHDGLVSDGQILGLPDEESENGDMTALIAATAESDRSHMLEILDKAGVAPHVVDTEPTAALNALMGMREPADEEPGAYAPAEALLDLGGRRASLYISADRGGFMNRTIWEGDPPAEDEAAEKEFIRTIATRALETLTFYRGRFRREVAAIHLMGGGALKAGRAETLAAALNRDVTTFDPMGDLADEAAGRDDVRGGEPTFVTSCGLCRWGDSDV